MAGARLRLQETDFPEPEEELGISHVSLPSILAMLTALCPLRRQECPGWQHCALCRSTRLGVETLRRARERRIEWRDTNTPLTNPIRVRKLCFLITSLQIHVHVFHSCAHWIWYKMSTHTGSSPIHNTR